MFASAYSLLWSFVKFIQKRHQFKISSQKMLKFELDFKDFEVRI